MVDSSYATQNKLTTGSTVTVAKTSFKVIGLVSEPNQHRHRRVHPARQGAGAGHGLHRQRA